MNHKPLPSASFPCLLSILADIFIASLYFKTQGIISLGFLSDQTWQNRFHSFSSLQSLEDDRKRIIA